MQTRMRSPAAHGPAIACACIWVSNCSSTRSAVRRSASSRSAVRLSGREDNARARARPAAERRPCLPCSRWIRSSGVRSTSSIASARSKIESGTVSRTRTRGDLRDDVVEALDVLDVDGGVDVDAVAQRSPRRRGSAWDDGCRAHWCGQAHRPARVRMAGDDGIEVHLLDRLAAVVEPICAERPRGPASRASVSLRPWVSTTPTTTSTPSLRVAVRAAAASRRSCRRRARRRRKS